MAPRAPSVLSAEWPITRLLGAGSNPATRSVRSLLVETIVQEHLNDMQLRNLSPRAIKLYRHTLARPRGHVSLEWRKRL